MGSNLLAFEGREKYNEYVANRFKNAKKSEKKVLEKLFKTYPGRLKAWEFAINEATEAMKLTLEDRINTYIYVYIEPLKTEVTDQPAAITKSKASESSKKSSDSKKKRKRKEGILSSKFVLV